jgi:hypothetical protein
MGGWKIESLGIDSKTFGSDLSDAQYGRGVKWRIADEEMKIKRVAAPVLQEDVVGQIDFSVPSISEGTLQTMEIGTLQQVAGQIGVPRVSKASKEELIKAILQKQG